MGIRRVLAKVRITSPELVRPRFNKRKAFPGDVLTCSVTLRGQCPLKLEDLVFMAYLRSGKEGGWSPLPGAIRKVEKKDGGFTGELQVPRVVGGKLCFFVWSKLKPSRQVKSPVVGIVRRQPIKIKRMDTHFLPGRENLQVFGKIPLWAKFMRVEVYSQGRTRRGLGGEPVHTETLPVTSRKGMIYQWNGVAKAGPLKGKPLTYFDGPFLLRMIAADKKDKLEPRVDPLASVPSNGRPFHLEVGKIELYYAPDPDSPKGLRPLRGTVNILEEGGDDGSKDDKPADGKGTLDGVAKGKLTVVAKLFLKTKKRTMGRKGRNLVAFAPELFGRAKPKLFWRYIPRHRVNPSAKPKKGASDFELTPPGNFPGELLRETARRVQGFANVEKAWKGYAGAFFKPTVSSSGPFRLGAVYPRYRVQRQSTRATNEAARFSRFKLRWLKVLPRILDLCWGAENPVSGSEIEVFGKVKGLPAGKAVKVEVCQGKKVVAKLDAKIAPSGGVLTRWNYEYDQDISEIAERGKEPKGPKADGPFTFKIKVPGMEAESPAIKPEDAIEFVLTDEDGEPMGNQAYRLHLPDGGVLDGESDDKGRIYHEGVPAGRCDLELLEDE